DRSLDRRKVGRLRAIEPRTDGDPIERAETPRETHDDGERKRDRERDREETEEEEHRADARETHRIERACRDTESRSEGLGKKRFFDLLIERQTKLRDLDFGKKLAELD